ncbi:hypothetical protein BDV95DRAFT_55343 [Massariosphaeria phaeospora]|uniref:Uncharacterized protein n=1 Tax=Massariosphaeria phaeospora TaxID=100035 RepID=A0A7C8MNF7_9PLEO|nr:hypothetical protein BDV95DRAFT_55343 [Massariosphaeria phaeospora]
MDSSAVARRRGQVSGAPSSHLSRPHFFTRANTQPTQLALPDLPTYHYLNASASPRAPEFAHRSSLVPSCSPLPPGLLHRLLVVQRTPLPSSHLTRAAASIVHPTPSAGRVLLREGVRPEKRAPGSSVFDPSLRPANCGCPPASPRCTSTPDYTTRRRQIPPPAPRPPYAYRRDTLLHALGRSFSGTRPLKGQACRASLPRHHARLDAPPAPALGMNFKNDISKWPAGQEHVNR